MLRKIKAGARSAYPSVTAVVASILLAMPAYAADDDDRWNILFSPYLWGVSLDGTTAVGPLPPLDVDASFGDILDSLNFAILLHTEFRKRKWTFVIDPTYFELELDIGQSVIIPVPPPPTPATVTGKIDIKMWFVEAWGSYEFADGWEVLGGVRWQSQEIKPSLSGGPPVPNIDVDWTDYFAGLRYSRMLGQKWYLTVRGDVAFAGDSDDSWNAIVFFSRRIGRAMALNLGYRYFTDDVNTSDGANPYAWDMDLTGPVVGYVWQFGGNRFPN